VHHLLLDRGLGHAAVTFTCVGINIAFIILAWFCRGLGPNYLLLVMLILSFSGLGLLYYRRKGRTMVIAKRMDGATELKTSLKVVTLTKEAQQAAEKN
jgi:hypothetical protein